MAGCSGGELVDRITLAKHGGLDTKLEADWTEVALRRSAELDNGHVTPVLGNEVSARLRKIVGR